MLKNLNNFNGVGPSKVYLPEGPYLTILDFLETRFPKGTRSGWEGRMLAGRVFNSQGHELSPSSPYLPRSIVYYYREVSENFVIPFQESILYEDAYLLIADKPHFLPVTPVGPYIQETLLVRLRNRTGIEDLSAVHRLDLETAGLVMFTKQAHTRDHYASLFRERSVEKTYLAVARHTEQHAWPKMYQSRIEDSAQFMKMQEIPGPCNAITQIKMLERRGEMALYQLIPTTGKKHQLRVHMNALGIPILNDQIYPQMAPYTSPGERKYDAPLQLLAQRLVFTDPITLVKHDFQSNFQLLWPK
jgi:tRNA pseudouridine32 synthase/23S rRNA pseudouridine746 synthase